MLGWDLHAESTHRAIGEFVSFGTVLTEFPRAFEAMVTCTRTLDRHRFCHDCPKCLEFALHVLDPERTDLRLGEEARGHLRSLRRAWGAVPFPAVTTLDAAAVEACGPLGREVAGVAARAHAVVRRGEGSDRDDLLLVGDEPAGQDHGAVLPSPELDAWARTWGVPGVDGEGRAVSTLS